jgi:hypothetical protein
VPKETNKTVVFLRVSDYDEVIKLERIAKSTLGRNLSALEYMDAYSYDMVMNQLPGV